MRVQRDTATRVANCALAALLSIACSTAWAQSGGQGSSSPASTKPSSATPPPEDLEPGVNTSATSSSSTEPAPAPAPPAAPAPLPKQAGSTTKSSTASHSVSKATAASATANPPDAGVAATAPKPGAAAGKAHDSIQLDTTQITGNRELPKVLYIVPWKRSDLGDLVGKPVNSLLDEVLTPVDRDVFKRQNRYYDALKPDESKQESGAAAGDKH
jgi:hypothetical protein